MFDYSIITVQQIPQAETGESCICQEDKCNTRKFVESVSKSKNTLNLKINQKSQQIQFRAEMLHK